MSVLLLLGGMGLATASGPTASVSTGSGSPQQWAYGSNTWYNTTSLTSTYALHETVFYGSQVVTTATNTSSSTVQLEAASATAFTESYLYCAPNCTTPSSSYYNLSLDEWSYETSFINVTSAATVYENNSSAPHGVSAAAAYGMSNATWITSSNYSEQYRYLLNGSPDYSGNDYSQSNGTFRVAFSPSIGMIPWTLSKNLTWNASSNATASYLGKSSYYVTYNGLHHYTIFDYGSAFTSWNIPESEAVSGIDLGNITLANGANATQIELGFAGALDVANGIFASPVSQDLFGGATGNWTVGVVAGALSHTTALSVVGGSSGYRIVASATAWTAPIRMIGLKSGSYSALPSPLASPSSGNSQAQPETVGYAQSAARCLVSSCGGAPTATSPGAPSGLAIPVWVVAAIAGTGAVLGSLIVVLRIRPRRPPTEGAPTSGAISPGARSR